MEKVVNDCDPADLDYDTDPKAAEHRRTPKRKRNRTLTSIPWPHPLKHFR